MSGKASRDKGYRGQREAQKILGSQFKNTGVAYSDAPDLTSDFAVISVKNQSAPLSLKKCLDEIISLELKAPIKNHFVAVKVNHKYLIIERIEQMRDDHCG